MKGSGLKGKLIDFCIFSLLFFVTAFGLRAAVAVLFRDEIISEEITVVSKPIPEEFARYISVGDDLYDTVTKRFVGRITELAFLDGGDGRYTVKIKLFCKSLPRGGAVRSPELYLEIDEVIRGEGS